MDAKDRLGRQDMRSLRVLALSVCVITAPVAAHPPQPFDQGDQPITPERLQAAAVLVTPVTQGDAKSVEAPFLAMGKEEFARGIAGLPAPQQARAARDFDAAFDKVWQRNVRRAHDDLVRYYAANLSDAEIATLTAFFATGIGYRQFHHREPLTAKDRQAFKQAMTQRPEVAKWVKLGMDMFQKEIAEFRPRLIAVRSDLNAELCPRLARDRIPVSICPPIRSGCQGN